MRKIFLSITVAQLILLASCTKKSDENPSPNTNNSPNNTNNTNGTVLYDTLWVTFKGKSYERIGPWYGIVLDGQIHSDFGSDYKTKPIFALNDIYLPSDSSKMLKLNVDTLKFRYINYYYDKYPSFFVGDTSKYRPGQPVYKGQTVNNTTYLSNQLIDRSSDANNFVKLTILKYMGVYKIQDPFAPGQSYFKSVWKVKGNFKFVLYNENHFNDSTTVQGNFSSYTSAAPY